MRTTITIIAAIAFVAFYCSNPSEHGTHTSMSMHHMESHHDTSTHYGDDPHADHSMHGGADPHAGHSMSGGNAGHMGHGGANAHAGHTAQSGSDAHGDHSAHGGAPAAYDLKVDTEPKMLVTGRPVALTLQVSDANGLMRDFELVHEKPLHLIMVNQALGGFQHLHPAQLPDGSFTVTTKFSAPGRYSLFAEVQPVGGAAANLIAHLQVDGETQPEPAQPTGAVPRLSLLDAAAGAMTFDFTSLGADLRLDPFLGAPAHVIMLRADGDPGVDDFVHAHPSHDLRSGLLDFHVSIPGAGQYKGWIQFLQNGELRTVPFDTSVL